MNCGWRGNCEVPQPINKTRIWVIGGSRRRWWGHEVGEGDPLGEGVKTHRVKVLGSQGLGVVGTGIERLGQLVKGAVEGSLKDTCCSHTRGKTEGVDDLLWTGVW